MADAKSINAKHGISLSYKLMAAYIGSALVAAVAVGIAAYVVASNIVKHDVQVELELTSSGQQKGLSDYFGTVAADLEYLSHSSMSQIGLVEFAGGWAGASPTDLQTEYIDDNPNPLGSKHLLDRAPGETEYNDVHAEFHPGFRTFLEVRGYYDIFLISPEGDIIYSVFKERDYATNLQNGEFKDSGLGEAFRKALAGDERAFVDFKPYAPSADAPAAFVASPVASKTGEVVGVVALQIPSDRIADAVLASDWVITYVIGSDGLLRTDLASTDENEILAKRVGGDWYRDATSGGDAILHLGDGILSEPSVLSAAGVDVFGQSWITIAETPIAVAYKPLADLRQTLLGVVIPIVALITAISAYFARSMATTIKSLAETMLKIANGDLDDEIKGADRGDEIGQMADALVIFRNNAEVQIAVTAAVQSNRTAMLVIDNECEVVAQNRAMDELWRNVGGVLGGLTRGSSNNAEDRTGIMSLNFGPFLAKVDELEADPARTKQKQSGDRALDLEIGDFIIEIKRSPVVDGFGKEMGFAFELSDVTSVRGLESDLIEVIDGVKHGTFDKRITHIDNLGFTSIAADGLNALMESIKAFMDELDRALAALAEGDLTRKISTSFQGDFKRATDQFNMSVSSLRQTMVNVEKATAEVRGAADPIATGSRDLASRAVSQAATLQETAATMEEMSNSIRENAEKAEKGAELSSRASELARAGGSVVSDTIDAMSRIEDSSAKISEIINVIEGIAFQTNLLALNAAVEAARAGEAGKGFAVVASEVRTLAQRSSEASQDIKGLINASAEHVSEGAALVNRTGESLESIVDAVQSVVATIAEISTSVRDQASGVSEITNSVNHLDEMTQSNSALADQSASAANDLYEAASRLADQVSAFQVEDGKGRGSADLAA